jgi:hypothetical protein
MITLPGFAAERSLYGRSQAYYGEAPWAMGA